jgi:chemotaxis methyl-accepting protein methylase
VVAVQAGMKSAGDVLRRLKDRPPRELEIKVVEALTTRGAERRLDQRSAACSSSQEAHSLAMMLSDHSRRSPAGF